jgi:hypothetical protein
MDIKIRVSSLLISSVWLSGIVLVALEAFHLAHTGQTGIVLSILGATVWTNRTLCALRKRELVAFDQGRRFEREGGRDLTAVK